MSQMSGVNKSPSIAVSRAKLLALMGLYAAPLLAAYLWFAYVSSNEGAGVSVTGELIHPAVPLESFELQSVTQEQWGLDEIRGKWSMVYFLEGECDQRCESVLYNMRQIRLSTGRRMERVQRVLVSPQWQQMTAKLSEANEGLAVVGGANIQVSALNAQFDKAQEQMPACDGCMYLVDPYGNLMMRFPADLEPAKILHDLKHLLKVSRIG